MIMNPLEVARKLAVAGVTMTTFAAAEAVRRSTWVSIGTTNFMARQALRGLDYGVSGIGYGLRIMNASDDPSAIQETEASMSTQDALSKLVTTLAITTSGVTLQEDFDRVVDKIDQIDSVADGIRMHDGPEGTVSMRSIAHECVAQVVSMGTEYGVDAQLAGAWVETMRERTGINGDA
jgi:hypothetical protein